MKNLFGFFCVFYPTLFVLMVTQLHVAPTNVNHVSILGRQKRSHFYFSIKQKLNISKVETMMTQDSTTQSRFTSEEHFLTLFTSFSSSMEKFYIYNNTIHNWLQMKPKVVLIFFSDNSKLRKYVSSIGWDLTLSVGLKSCNGTPVLKDMFLTAQKLVNSKLYAYANADILFNQGFLSTLEGVVNNAAIYRNPILLSGKRSDLLLNVHKITNIRGEKEVERAFKKSHISYGYAEDYFVVNREFPWKIYPNLAIGREIVDNYLAFVARKNKVTTIDASGTIGALHQKTKSRVKKPSDCNKKILGTLYSRRKIARGNVECFSFETRFDFDSKVFLMKRGQYTTVC